MFYKTYTCDFICKGVVGGSGITRIPIWKKPKEAWDILKSMGHAEGASPIRFRRVR